MFVCQGVSETISDRFFLNSYLIKPFQRITKYKIFIEEMIKHTNKTDLKGKMKEYYDKLKVRTYVRGDSGWVWSSGQISGVS